jgi:MoaA/NifB/PqqE/SkfB family radical SAM enzyme
LEQPLFFGRIRPGLPNNETVCSVMSNALPRQRLEAANAAHQDGRLETAAEIYRELLTSPEVALPARFNLACVQLRQGLLSEAAEGLTRTLAEDPSNPYRPWAVREMGLALFRHNFWEVARPWLEEALIEYPDDPAVQQAWSRSRPPPWLAPEAFDAGRDRTLLRAAPREGSSYVYTIDVVGTCNLRCPSCPVGNLTASSRPRGFMPLGLFEQIVDKLIEESPVPRPEIWLFNWGEPLLHPDLPAMIKRLNQHHLPSFLSTNLNIRKGLDKTIAANPGTIKVSLSGFSQATYGKTHARGRIDRVKDNLYRIRRLIDRYRVGTRVWIGQHVYQTNRHEVEPVAELCRELDFDHRPIAAYYQPLEKMLDIAEGRMSDEPILGQLLEHPAEYLSRQARWRDQRYDCELRANQTVINHDGSVALCCTVYEPANMLGVNFVDTKREQIETLKYEHETCSRCQRAGLAHVPSRLARSST